MKKTIKIIDLIVKVANGEELPENIEYDNKVMKYDHNKQDYKGYYSNGNGDYLFQFLFDKCRNTEHFINDYVEILDEEEFEDIEEKSVYMDFSCDYWKQAQIDELANTLTRYELAIKKIIRNQKKIIERLENDRN